MGRLLPKAKSGVWVILRPLGCVRTVLSKFYEKYEACVPQVDKESRAYDGLLLEYEKAPDAGCMVWRRDTTIQIRARPPVT